VRDQRQIDAAPDDDNGHRNAEDAQHRHVAQPRKKIVDADEARQHEGKDHEQGRGDAKDDVFLAETQGRRGPSREGSGIRQ